MMHEPMMHEGGSAQEDADNRLVAVRATDFRRARSQWIVRSAVRNSATVSALDPRR